MSKSDFLENAILNLIFRAVAIANIADNAAASPLTSLFWALHTADPGDAGTQATSEATYTGYARVSVARPAGMAAASGGSISPAANIDFPACTGGTNTITHASVGVATSGATNILYSGTVTPNIAVANGVTPRLTTASTVTED